MTETQKIELTAEDWLALKRVKNNYSLVRHSSNDDFPTLYGLAQVGLLKSEPSLEYDGQLVFNLTPAGRAALAERYPPAVVLEYRAEWDSDRDQFRQRAAELVQAGYKAAGYTACALRTERTNEPYAVVSALFVLSGDE